MNEYLYYFYYREKAVENIKEALKYTAKTSLIGTSPAEVASAVSWAEVLLLRALKEQEDLYDKI